MGKILEVQIQLHAGYVGAFVHVKVNLDVNNKLERFISTTKGWEKGLVPSKIQEVADLCNKYGLIGHWYEECGTG